MAKRKTGVGKNKTSRSKKTKKRLATKAARPVKKNRAGGKNKSKK
jgi:hypothetical protein